MTMQEFVETARLYNRVAIENFDAPASITRMCNDPGCKKDTTWRRSDVKFVGFKITNSDDRSYHHAAYICGLCSDNSMVVHCQTSGWCVDPNSKISPKAWRYTAVRKIGQDPPPEISIPADLNDQLGATASHYKRALATRSHNYGIAAMAYLRRVVDEKTDELIDIMAELSRTSGASEEEM